ncbi:MAG TPA: M23 family metallopeptidase, partial [Flavitalea sp.]|nr:M23 family metallopeptidase [Flavitalea sp.]
HRFAKRTGMFKLQKQKTATLNKQITATSDKQKAGQNEASGSLNSIAGYSRKLKSIFLLSFILLLMLGITAIVSRSTGSFFPAWSDPLEIPVKLSANFGEIRPDHWHMGLDIRTNGKENYDVRAVAGGYVSRIIVGSEGYGKAVYITHPNNRTSLYAHLNSFYDKLETFVNNVSVKTESWEQDIKLQPGMFPVTKGMLIGLSGNTGHSGGPHLHFEWRNSLTGKSLNPQLEVLQVEDKVAPAIEDVYWYDRRQSTSQQNPHRLNISSRNPNNNIIEVTSPIVSLGISAVDKISQSPFNMGIYQIKTSLDDKPVFRFSLDSISETNNKNINGCIDYTTWFRNGNIIQHLSKLKGGGYDNT